MDKSIMVYGAGALGCSLISDLASKGINLFSKAYVGPNDEEYISTFDGQEISFERSYKLKDQDEIILSSHVSHIVVTLSGKILEQEIDFLLSQNIPLIILSTGYDESFISMKIEECAGIAVLSQNMALGIVDFWNRVEQLDSFSGDDKLSVLLKESHQNVKKDVSGSGIKIINLLSEKRIGKPAPIEELKNFYIFNTKRGVSYSGEFGNIEWHRDEEDQLDFGVPKEYINGHAYHKFYIIADMGASEETLQYLKYIEKELKSLSNYSIEGKFEFKVFMNNVNVLCIIHNINGRAIYSEGVIRSIDFLSSVIEPGVFTGIDVINHG